MAEYISTIVLPGDNTTYYIKDSEGRTLIANKQDIINAANKLSAAYVSGLATVATSGSYDDLTDKPYIPEGATVDTAMSDSSPNAVQNRVIKAYVDNLISGLGALMHFKGAKTSEAQIKAITSATIGDVWLNSEDGSEWVCTRTITAADATAWEKFGTVVDLTPYAKTADLGDLAFKDSASGSYTPEGSVSQPTFSGNSMTATGTFTPAGGVTVTTNTTENKTATVTTTSGTATYTPAGTVTQPTFSGNALSSTGKFTPAGNVTVSTNTTTNKTATVAPAGSGDATYTPAGSVSVTPTVTLNTDVVNSITAVGSLPAWSASVTGEVLSFSWSEGTLPTKGANQTVATSVKSATATGSFSGTGVRLVTGNIEVPATYSASFNGTEGNVSVSGTPSGTVTQPEFEGTGVRLITGNIPVPATYSASFSGTEGSVSVSGTPSGTVSKPTFSGTAKNVTVS